MAAVAAASLSALMWTLICCWDAWYRMSWWEAAGILGVLTSWDRGAKGEPCRKGDLSREIVVAGECTALRCWVLAACILWLNTSLLGDIALVGVEGEAVVVMEKAGLYNSSE